MSNKIPRSDYENLAKLTKLLEKVENEIRKKREDNVYNQTTEKFLEHMKKTSEVYSLVIDEVIGSLYVMGLNEHTDVLKKLFRGVQQQITSVLKFSLKYYIQKSSELEGLDPKAKDKQLKNKEPPVEILIDKRTLLPYCETHLKGKKTEQFQSSGRKVYDLPQPSGRSSLGRPSPGHYVPSHINFDPRPSQFNPYAQNHGPDSVNTSFKPGNLVMGGYRQSPYAGMSSPNRDLNHRSMNMNTSENYNYGADPDSEMDSYRHETDMMQREIDDLLEGKKNLDNYNSSDISTSLKQVLKGLEGFRKKVKAIGDENADDDNDEENQPDFSGFTGNVMGAFEKAQKKTAKKVIGYTMNRTVESKPTASIGTMPDLELLEAEKKFYRKELEEALEQKAQELNYAKKKITLLEQDRNTIHDKYAKISLEHSGCEQKMKELQIKINSMEKECEHLKRIIEDVKKGKIDRLFLTKEQEEVVKKNLQMAQNPEDLNQALMMKLQESRREAKILKYQLQHNGERPPSSYLEENEEESTPITSFTPKPTHGKGAVKKVNKSKYAENSQDTDTPEAVEDEEEVIVNGKVPKAKKPVYGQKKTREIIKDKGQKVEEEEDVDVGETQVEKYQKILKGNSNNTKTGANGNKLVKIVTKNKKGDEVQWVGSSDDLDINGDDEDNVIIKTGNGQALRKVVKRDKNGNEVVEWIEALDDEDQDEASNAERAGYTNRNRKIKQNKENGIMMLQEEVEEEETIIDENGNEITVKKKVLKNKQVKKLIDENGEEVIEEDIVDPVTGEKTTVRRRVKDLENAEFTQVESGSGEIIDTNTAPETRKAVKHQEVQTMFMVEDMIKSALASAGIKGDALVEMAKVIAKNEANLATNPKVSKENKKEEYEEIMIPGQGKKKIVYQQGQDTEEVEYITKDGLVVKKKLPKGTKDEYEITEDGNLVLKEPIGKGKAINFRGRQKKSEVPREAEKSKLDESMVSVTSVDEEGNVVKKKKPRRLVPVDQGGSKKLTLDDYIRREEELENNGPPLTKEETQARAMYKSMLTKAKQDPKLMDMFKKFLKDKGVDIEDEANFIVDFEGFKDFLTHFKAKHKRCGESCGHLQKFYARIGYYPNWNNRVPLEMKKPEIAHSPAKPVAVKLPMISPRKAITSRTNV